MKNKGLSFLFVYLWAGLGVLLINSCKKTEDPILPTPAQKLTVTITYANEGLELKKDELIYMNDAGNKYSVSTLNYYLSGFAFQDVAGKWHNINKVFYVNAFEPDKNKIILPNIPKAEYQTIKFNIGLDEALNLSNSLPATPENINMEWPDMMGGGYHFLKLEGSFLDKDLKTAGYAMHLGKSGFHTEVTISKTYSIAAGSSTLGIEMNVAEWFRNPNLYDFNVQGNYSMGIDSSMKKLSENGKDIFTFK